MSTDSVEVERITHLPLAQLSWRPIDPGDPYGPEIAALWGDPSRSAFGALIKVPAGFQSPVHSHSHSEHVVQVLGRSVHWIAGDPAGSQTILSRGDYVVIPGGVGHVSATRATESIELITMGGPFDIDLAPATVERGQWRV